MFIGRKGELKTLEQCINSKQAHLVVCTGRRRIGKSSLIEQAGEKADFFLEIQGLHPSEAPREIDQLKHFAEVIRVKLKRPKMVFLSWTEAFNELSIILPKKKSLLFLDEISWMSSGSKTFSSELKVAWDTLFKKNPGLTLVLAGSVSSWIEENILNQGHFFGRVSVHIKLEELPLNLLKKFWGSREKQVSSYDFIKIISIFGGVPRYLEEIDPKLSAEQNILKLCFSSSGFLVNEFEKIFKDVFDRRSETYRKIVEVLLLKPMTLNEVAKKMKKVKSGIFTKYLDDLVSSGFLVEDKVFDFDGRKTKLSKFRVKDNYLRFALKYILPYSDKILAGQFVFKSLTQLPSWSTIIGLQFENLVLQNRWIFALQLGINRSDVINCGPHYQQKTTKNKGACQIDLMITTKDNQLYLCEIKFVKKLGAEVIREVKRKIEVLKRPKIYTIHPVLIYAGELAPSIVDLDFFKLISIEDLEYF